MKRVIYVTAGSVKIVASIDTNGHELCRDEIETVRDQLADRLQDAAADLRWIGVPRNRVKVL